jgi:hypothetical protein
MNTCIIYLHKQLDLTKKPECLIWLKSSDWEQDIVDYGRICGTSVNGGYND